MRVLLADDHVMIREGLRPFIQRIAEDIEVIEAGTFAEVEQILSENENIDLIILDMIMPGMHGLSGLETLRAKYPSIRVVILSANSERHHIAEAMRLGADGFIPKMMSSAALVSALQLILSGERFIPSLLMENSQDIAPSLTTSDPEIFLKLTPRERDILTLLQEGHANKVIANRLSVSEVTVKSHLGSAFRKLGVRNRLQAMRLLMGRS